MQSDDLKRTIWLPLWFPGKDHLPYARDSSLGDAPYTNNESWEVITKSQLITWGFRLTQDNRLPNFVLNKAREHAAKIASQS